MATCKQHAKKIYFEIWKPNSGDYTKTRFRAIYAGLQHRFKEVNGVYDIVSNAFQPNVFIWKRKILVNSNTRFQYVKKTKRNYIKVMLLKAESQSHYCIAYFRSYVVSLLTWRGNVKWRKQVLLLKKGKVVNILRKLRFWTFSNCSSIKMNK